MIYPGPLTAAASMMSADLASAGPGAGCRGNATTAGSGGRTSSLRKMASQQRSSALTLLWRPR